MNKGLYDKFGSWYHGGSVWFYSDPHFSDDEMKHLRHNYIGDDEQVKRINSKVGKKDTLIILGDVGNLEFVRKLRGYKVLIMGNHDVGQTKYLRQKYESSYPTEVFDKKDAVADMTAKHPDCTITSKLESDCFGEFWHVVADNSLFDEVYEGELIIGPKIILSHEPVEGMKSKLNVHGHVHDMKCREDEYHMNVCAEWINYTPVKLKDILESGRLKDVKSIHRETIDKATRRKKSKQCRNRDDLNTLDHPYNWLYK